MELQLGLALSLPVHNLDRGFDLNNIHGFGEKKEMIMDVETWSYGCSKLDSKNHVRNKRSFDVAFEKSTSGNDSKMLRLLLWNGQPNDDDDEKAGQKRTDTSITKNDDGGNHVVGWPPIKSLWRKKMVYQHHHPLQNHRLGYRENENNGSANSLYVKVKMEGVGIVRKIDLRRHHSYHTLKHTLITMFSKCQRCDSKEGCEGSDYILTYQDKQGDWLLVADVPWQTFIESVQRLQILRNGG